MSPRAASRTIVAIARPDHGFFDDCMSQLYSHADNSEYSLVYQLLRSQDEDMESFEAVLGSAAGFILFGTYLAPLAKSLRAAGNRVVIIGAPDPSPAVDAPCVCNDQEAGGYLAVKHFVDLGHRRIGFQYNYEIEMRSPRRLGTRRALDDLRKGGLAVKDTIIDLGQLEAWDADPAMARRDLEGSDAPTALVAWNDFTAARMLSILQRAKFRIPEDISVIGYDNASIADRSTPRLTTIDSGVAQLLGVAIRTIQLPRDVEPAKIQMTIPHLIVRNSTAPPKT